MKYKCKIEKRLTSMTTKLNTLERFNKGELLKNIFCHRWELRAVKNGKIKESVLRTFRSVCDYYCILKKLELELVVNAFWVWPMQERMQNSS